RRDALYSGAGAGAKATMNALNRILLINPTITSRRSARFPLAVLNLSASLDGRYTSSIIDGNVDRDFVSTAVRAVQAGDVAAVGVSVMGGPQLPTAIAVSQAIRASSPATPIIWGGHFPTICPEAVLSEPYVDYAVRGQGEDTFTQLFDTLSRHDEDAVAAIAGLSWRRQEQIVHKKERTFSARSLATRLPYERLENP